MLLLLESDPVSFKTKQDKHKQKEEEQTAKKYQPQRLCLMFILSGLQLHCWETQA